MTEFTQDSADFHVTDDHLETGRVVFSSAVDFVLGVAHLSQLPKAQVSEIAFVGRSNVGKSSLLNALTGRKNLARASNTPGRTQEMNFFRLSNQAFLVDLPGYGYAKVTKSDSRNWTALLKSYLKGRAQLRLAIVLIDARHGIKDNDTEMMAMLDAAAVPYQIVLTKADKIKKSDYAPLVEQTAAALKKHPAAFPHPILTSAETKMGMDLLRGRLMLAF